MDLVLIVIGLILLGWAVFDYSEDDWKRFVWGFIGVCLLVWTVVAVATFDKREVSTSKLYSTELANGKIKQYYFDRSGDIIKLYSDFYKDPDNMVVVVFRTMGMSKGLPCLFPSAGDNNYIVVTKMQYDAFKNLNKNAPIRGKDFK